MRLNWYSSTADTMSFMDLGGGVKDPENSAVIGRKVIEFVVEGGYHGGDDRLERVRGNIRDHVRSFTSEAAESRNLVETQGRRGMSNSPIHPGAVVWTGENPGIYLKNEQDGPWTGLVTFFRITWSEHGRGHGVVLLDEPDVEKSLPEVANFCITDNEALAKYLVDEFFANFASFKVSPGLKAIQYLPLTEVYREGDTRSTYTEVVKSADQEVRMTWKELGAPYAVDMPPEKGPTKVH